MSAIVDDDLWDELVISVGVDCERRVSRRGKEGGNTWMDQQTAPRVPRTSAAIGTSILVFGKVLTLLSKTETRVT